MHEVYWSQPAVRMVVRCAIVLVGVQFALLGSFGCATTGNAKRFHAFKASFKEVTPSGDVVFTDHDPVRLAGIQIRPVSETEEPELLNVAGQIVSSADPRVKVVLDRETQTAVVYYKQRVHIRDLYGPVVVKLLWTPRYARGSINELLIVLGAAKYDPALGEMKEEAYLACETAQEKADLALWNKRRYTPLRLPKTGLDRVIFREKSGYRARITKGDVDIRDRNLAEGEERIQALDALLSDSENAVAHLIKALSDDNRIVRRHAAYSLACMSQLDASARPALERALHDEDRHVRSRAADALKGLK